MSIIIKPVITKKEKKLFVTFYTALYKKNKQVAFPMHLDEIKTLGTKNPAHQFCKIKCWLAYRDNKVVGRIAAIINEQEQVRTQKSIGRFGWFDFEDDYKISTQLMEEATAWLRVNSIDTLHGSMGFSDMDRQGLLIEGHDLKSTMGTLYNYGYYSKHIDKLSFKKSTDWIEFLIYPEVDKIRRVGILAERCKRMHNLRSLTFTSRRELKKRAVEVFQLINQGYNDLYGYVPLNTEQIKYYTEIYLSFVNLDLLSVVVDDANKIVAAGLSMPSLTEALQKAKGKLYPMGVIWMLKALRQNPCIDLYLIAIANEYQGKGINSIVMHDIARGAVKVGAKVAETTLELEDNFKIHNMWRQFDAKQHKRRRCYIKDI